jgi:hypothetical protein
MNSTRAVRLCLLLALVQVIVAGGPSVSGAAEASSPVYPQPMACCGEDIGHHLNLPWHERRTDALIDKLGDCCPYDRREAARQLGCCINTNACRHPEIVPNLVHALVCDSAWQVRKKAAWSLAYQRAANQCGWTALYLASRLDPHYMVRDCAANALKVIETQVGLNCIRTWKVRGDALAKEMKPKYKPGTASCCEVFSACCGACSNTAANPPDAPRPSEL